VEEKVAKQISKDQLAKLLTDNNREEQSAIAGYLSLLDTINSGGIVAGFNYKEVVNVIKEIVADEMNHTQKLSQLISQLSGIAPNAE